MFKFTLKNFLVYVSAVCLFFLINAAGEQEGLPLLGGVALALCFLFCSILGGGNLKKAKKRTLVFWTLCGLTACAAIYTTKVTRPGDTICRDGSLCQVARYHRIFLPSSMPKIWRAEDLTVTGNLPTGEVMVTLDISESTGDKKAVTAALQVVLAEMAFLEDILTAPNHSYDIPQDVGELFKNDISTVLMSNPLTRNFRLKVAYIKHSN